MPARARAQEFWSPGVVVFCGLVALFGLALAGLGLFEEHAAYLVRVARGRVPRQGDRPRRRRHRRRR